jgi:hypothetical protein
MASHHLDRLARDRAVEQSLVAALEVNDVLRDKRKESPALVELISTLTGHRDLENPRLKRDLLADSQFASLSSRAATYSGKDFGSSSELDGILSLLIQASKVGLTSFSKDQLSFIRDFCVGLNSVFVEEISTRMSEPPLARARQPQLASVN